MALHAFSGALLLAAFLSATAHAQQPGTPEEKREGSARFFDPADQQFDLGYFLENPRGFLPVPIIITEPAVGSGGGAIGMFLRPRRDAGDEGFARPNISALGGFKTQNGTWGGFAGDTSRWMDGRLRTLAGIATGVINLDFYGVGTTRIPFSEERARYSLEFSGGLVQANWQLAPKSPWAIGLRYVYADVNPKLREDAGFPGLADRVRVKVSAPAPILEFDSRDNVFTPTRGVYSESSWLASREALGATEDFDRFQQVLMAYYPLRRDITFAARTLYGWTSRGAPFFLRPYIDLRGVPAARFQGEHAVSVEIETQWRFSGRWSVVGFGGTGRTWSSRGSRERSDSVGGGGIGFRYELARKFGLHAGVDAAWAGHDKAIYFQVGSAWFRP